MDDRISHAASGALDAHAGDYWWLTYIRGALEFVNTWKDIARQLGRGRAERPHVGCDGHTPYRYVCLNIFQPAPDS